MQNCNSLQHTKSTQSNKYCFQILDFDFFISIIKVITLTGTVLSWPKYHLFRLISKNVPELGSSKTTMEDSVALTGNILH
jgi:hypothetical protein